MLTFYITLLTALFIILIFSYYISGLKRKISYFKNQKYILEKQLRVEKSFSITYEKRLNDLVNAIENCDNISDETKKLLLDEIE